ncbi:hypothetical protein GALMADRAFT_1367632, partial [Galerina marginata CBS 339.88]
MSVFEGLFPGPDDQFVQDMFFTLCTWHAYAKLRLHTTSTLTGLKELPREEAARVRRRANAAYKGNSKKATPDGKKKYQKRPSSKAIQPPNLQAPRYRRLCRRNLAIWTIKQLFNTDG